MDPNDFCKVCGILRCPTHVQEEWVVCVWCGRSKYHLKVHPKCPACGKEPESQGLTSAQ